MSYSESCQFEHFVNYLQTTLKLLGYEYEDQERGVDSITITKNGETLVLNREKIMFLMGETTAEINIFLNAIRS